MFLFFLFTYLVYFSVYDYLYLKILHRHLLGFWIFLEMALYFHAFSRLSWTEVLFNLGVGCILFFLSFLGKGLGMGDVKFLLLLAFYLPFFSFTLILFQSFCLFLFFYFFHFFIEKIFPKTFPLPKKLPFLPFYCPFLFWYFFSFA